jgi:hypothetical protein
MTPVISAPAALRSPVAAPPRSGPAAGVLFEYVGATGMTVMGGATGARYRFAQTGARVMVDSRDAPSVSAVPNVRKVWRT